ncbi:MAG: metal-dependent transcriptional regulator [Clostridiales bacterium]|nr:metal-dependent transcriptional regulator [Clostridiales bacterium]
MRIQESGEDYLETILILKNRKGYVRSVDIANELGYSKPSVSRAMGILKEAGYITVESGGSICLTEKGQQKAEAVYERHLTITNYLHRVLDVPSDIAAKDACRIEHIISEETFDAIKNAVK